MLGKCTRDLALILRYLWCNGDVLGFSSLWHNWNVKELSHEWQYTLCSRVYCHCSYCFNLGMVSFWLTSCRNHICFRKIMSSISLIVTHWLRNSDFPGLQNGEWILCVTLSNSWTHSCNPLRQPIISSVCAIEVLGLFGFYIWRKLW